MKRAVMYLRVSTIDQTTANQERQLREIAGRMGCEVVKVATRVSKIEDILPREVAFWKIMMTAARWHTCARRRNRWLPRGRLSWVQSRGTLCFSSHTNSTDKSTKML
jgi:hypothetical protein